MAVSSPPSNYRAVAADVRRELEQLGGALTLTASALAYLFAEEEISRQNGPAVDGALR